MSRKELHMSPSEQEPEQTDETQPHDRPVNRYWRAAYLFCGAVSIAGLFTRLTVTDRWLFLSTIYYATPLALLCVGCLCSAICTWALKWRRQSLVWAVLSVAMFFAWSTTCFSDKSQPTVESDISVMFWNVARKKDMAPAANLINQVDADVVALVESGWANAERRQFWEEHCPNYDISLLGGGLLVMTKGTSGTCVAEELAKNSIYRRIDCQVNGHELTCVVVDLKSDPYYSRRPVLGKLANELAPFRDKNLVVMGDFNTPVESVHFGPMRQFLREAFEVSGKGYAPTWPHPAPVLWLDQIWVGPTIQPIQCHRLTPVNSDHRPVLAMLRIADEVEEESP